ncbi:MAG TPA: two-component regulator propeller domain-containing protein [Pyrinomonadaceae bacterium]|nr:two-component regulator propeller domain-containing protein [Pyrinomonadaceae bacterium]
MAPKQCILCGLCICLWLVLFSPSAFALDPQQPLTQLYHSSWNAKNGLNGSVNALAQTTDGFFWIGTTDGLYRFDGLFFELYKPEVNDLPSVAVSTLMALPDGGLWIGYLRGGASLLKDGRVTNYSEAEGFPVGRVRSFAQDHDGTIWAGVVGGFTRFDGSRWHTIRADWNYPSRSAWTLYVDKQGTLWVTTGRGIMFLPKGETKFHDTGVQSEAIYAFTQAPDGTMLFHDHGQHTVRAFRPATNTHSDPLPQFSIPAEAIRFDRDGALWLAGDGVSRIPFPNRLSTRVSQSSRDVERFTEEQGLTENVARALLEDREGNMWVGTDGGLDRFRFRNVAWFPFPSGTTHFSLVAGNNGDVWSGSNGTTPWPLARVSDATPVNGAPTQVFTTYRDPDGAIWISAQDKLLRWHNGVFTSIPPREEMLKLARTSATKDPITVSSITRGAAGTMWVAYGGAGEFQFKDGVWKFVPVIKEHTDWAPSYAFTDSTDKVWLVYVDRLVAIEGENLRTYAAAEGLTIGPVNLVAGRDRQLWAGGQSGLAFLKDDRFHKLSTTALELGSITGLVVRDDGLWLSANAGIVHIPQSEIQQVLQQPAYLVSYELFDLVSDLPEQLQRGSVYSYSSGVIESSDGLLWFATRSGIARLNPAQIFRNPLPPPVAIRSLIADGKSYSTLTNASLPALTKNVRLDYTALSLSVPERVRFRYKLENWDKEWQEAGIRRQAFYTNLGPGNYVFRVAASNNDGVWNQEAATFRFTVAPAWYQTAWFRLFFLALFILLAWLAYRLRVRQLSNAMSARFDERLAERTQLARELHDTFLQTIQGSKMVADDALDGPADPTRLRRAIEQISVWLAQATEEGRAALNSLRTTSTEKNDLTEALRRATQNGLLPTSMAIDFTVVGEAKEMHPIVSDEVYRIGYEAIRNSLMHSHGKRLEVRLKYAQDLSVSVKDDGTGIDPMILANGKHGHFGLQGMRERAERIGGKLTLISLPKHGTEITLVVPGDIVFHTNRKGAK